MDAQAEHELDIVQAYGIVWKALDKKTGEIIALKKIFDAFQNATDAQASAVCKPRSRFGVLKLAQHECAANFNSRPTVHQCHALLCLQRTFREIMFLQELNNHENIIRCGTLSTTWICAVNMQCTKKMFISNPGLAGS